MKVHLNKTTLSQMPEQVRDIVLAWKNRYRKTTISVKNTTTGFYAAEDAHVTMINLKTGASAHAQAAGEFAGFTKLSPGSLIPLPVGVVAVEEGFFCGYPVLTVWQGSSEQITAEVSK